MFDHPARPSQCEERRRHKKSRIRHLRTPGPLRRPRLDDVDDHHEDMVDLSTPRSILWAIGWFATIASFSAEAWAQIIPH